MKALPAKPIPPETIKAPEEVDVLAVVLVTAKPDNDTLPVNGFTTNDVIVDKPNPELLEVLTAVTKNEASTVVGATATEDAAAGGTASQVGKVPLPFDVSTCPDVLLAANLPHVVVVVA
jgi:hypothetical protein